MAQTITYVLGDEIEAQLDKLTTNMDKNHKALNKKAKTIQKIVGKAKQLEALAELNAESIEFNTKHALSIFDIISTGLCGDTILEDRENRAELKDMAIHVENLYNKFKIADISAQEYSIALKNYTNTSAFLEKVINTAVNFTPAVESYTVYSEY